MKIIGIYCITNTITGDQYVGQSLDIKRRFNQHRRKQKNFKFRRDVEKYGIDSFKFEILEECKVEMLTERENYYLKLLKPYYNIKTEDQAISEEARQKLSKLQTGRKRPEISKPVKCVETGEIFPSIIAAAKSCNVASSNMTMLLHGKGRTLGGFHWIFYDPENEAAELERIRQMPEGRKNTPESIEKMRKAKLGKVLTAATREKMRQAHSANPCKGWTEETIKKLSREIICIETGEIFPSIKAAAEKYNLKASNISAVLAGNKNTAGGFHWKYADGGTAQYRPDSMRRKNSKPVICVETGEIFPSVKAAAESVGFTYTAIAMVVNGEREKSGGYHWKYYFENDDENLAEMI